MAIIMPARVTRNLTSNVNLTKTNPVDSSVVDLSLTGNENQVSDPNASLCWNMGCLYTL